MFSVDAKILPPKVKHIIPATCHRLKQAMWPLSNSWVQRSIILCGQRRMRNTWWTALIKTTTNSIMKALKKRVTRI